MTTPLITLTGLGFAYPRQPPVLDEVLTSFNDGSVHAITGPSGCGKSTLLYVIAMMLRTKQGSLSILGREYAGASDQQRSACRRENIGFVFQDALLETSMTVRENVFDGLPLTRSRSGLSREVDGHLERLGLVDLAERKASRLSGGQAQRVALARAVLKRPALLLADEPTGNLDHATAAVVLEELFAYGRQPGHATIIVTHDQRIADRADSVLRLTPVAS